MNLVYSKMQNKSGHSLSEPVLVIMNFGSFQTNKNKWINNENRKMKKTKSFYTNGKKPTLTKTTLLKLFYCVFVFVRIRCLNIVTRAHDANLSIRVQIVGIWNETFRREKKKVRKKCDRLAKMVRTLFQLCSACMNVCVCIYCYACVGVFAISS